MHRGYNGIDERAMMQIAARHVEWVEDVTGQIVGLDTAALHAGATTFLTNDERLAVVPDLNVLVLDALHPGSGG
jgi:hypothetical protein